jgi:hypothetical protein
MFDEQIYDDIFEYTETWFITVYGRAMFIEILHNIDN